MPPKKKKGAAKKKKISIYTTPEHLGLFGIEAPGKLLRTPLGCTVTVMGVKYATGPEDRSSARLIVRYPNGLEAPLESHGATDLMDMGFRLAAESVHIMRDVASYKLEQRIAEEKQMAFELQTKLRLEALNIENKGRGKKNPIKIGGAPRPQTR